MPKAPRFDALSFGRLDAAEEASVEPYMLTDGFFDLAQGSGRIERHDASIVLGVKGAGKSAVLENVRLRKSVDLNQFVDRWDLSSFPVADVRNIKTGQTAGLTRTQNAWEFLLLMRVLDSLNQDPQVNVAAEFKSLWSSLRNAGFFVSDWRTKVVELTRSTVKFNLTYVEAGAEVVKRDVLLLHLTEIVRRQLATLYFRSQHFVLLDGLDSLFFEFDNEWESLGGLLQALVSLNNEFRERSLSISLVAAVRSDLYSIIPSSETNKYRLGAIELDWSSAGVGQTSPLWKMIDNKASASVDQEIDIVNTYLSGEVQVGPRAEPAAEYLLEYTRLLPRDLVAVLSVVKELSGNTAGPLPESVLKRAVDQYSKRYFVGEVFNNLHGVISRSANPARKVAAFQDSLSTVKERRFTVDWVKSTAGVVLSDEEIYNLLRQLYEISAIGIKETSGSMERTNFRYRSNSGVGFSINGTFVLHNALTRAWNRFW